MIYIFWTCRDQEEARRIIHGLLDEKLIACASILPMIESIYRWEGKIETSSEAKVILKTTAQHFEAIEGFIKTHCSYEVPEIVQIDIEQGSSSYLDWVTKETIS